MDVRVIIVCAAILYLAEGDFTATCLKSVSRIYMSEKCRDTKNTEHLKS